MKILLILLPFITASHVFAQEILEQDREELLRRLINEKISREELNKYPEIYQFSDSVLSERSIETGIRSDAYYTRQDDRRFSLSYSFSYDYEDITKIQTFDLNYFNQFDNSYRQMWWGAQIKSTTAKYDAIADERTSTSGNSNSVANTTRNSELQSFTIMGLGLGHRFKILAEAFDTQRMFEFIAVYANYILHVDNTNSDTYSGYGYNAEYSINRRTNGGFFYGAKLSYNWALVEKAPVDDEKLNDRSLVFGWTSVGFELGYIF